MNEWMGKWMVIFMNGLIDKYKKKCLKLFFLHLKLTFYIDEKECGINIFKYETYLKYD